MRERPPDSTDDAFLPEVLAELRKGRFRPAAIRRFLALSWQRSWNNIRARPRRHASTLGWIAVVSAALALVLLAGPPIAGAPRMLLGILGWHMFVSANTWLHQGLVRSLHGRPFDRFGLPNGLSYMRLSLASVIPWLIVAGGVEHVWLTLGLLAVLALADLADGMIARHTGMVTRFGRTVDPFGDIVLLSCLAGGLYVAGAIPALTCGLVLFRFLGTFMAVMLTLFVAGPMTIAASWFGKVTMFATVVVLSATLLFYLTVPEWLDHAAFDWTLRLLDVMLILSSAYHIWLGSRVIHRHGVGGNR